MFAARFGGRLFFSPTHEFRWLLFARSSPLAVPKIPGVAVGCQNWEASLDFNFGNYRILATLANSCLPTEKLLKYNLPRSQKTNVGPLASRVILTVPTRLAVPARQEDQ
jgi:hypothetical protein